DSNSIAILVVSQNNLNRLLAASSTTTRPPAQPTTPEIASTCFLLITTMAATQLDAKVLTTLQDLPPPTLEDFPPPAVESGKNPAVPVHSHIKHSSTNENGFSLWRAAHHTHRLLIFACAIFYIVTCLKATSHSIAILYGVALSPAPSPVPPDKFMAEAIGTTTLRESPLVKTMLNGDTSPRAGVLYLNASGHSFTQCSMPPMVSNTYVDTFMRATFTGISHGASYNLTFLDPDTIELVVPIVDCESHAIVRNYYTVAILFYLVRNRADHDDVSVMRVMMSNQDYNMPGQSGEGAVLTATIAFANDLRVPKIDQHFAVSVGYPFENFNFRAATLLESTEFGLWRLRIIPTTGSKEIYRTIETATRSGFFLKGENEQSNVNTHVWALPNTPIEALTWTQWYNKPGLRDTWAWVHFHQLLLAIVMISDIVILLMITLQKLRLGKLWIGDAFVSVYSVLLLRGAFVLISWCMNEFWGVLEFCLSDATTFAPIESTTVFPSVIEADLRSIYISVCGLLGIIFRTRVDPLVGFVSFEIVFQNRLAILKWFPSIVAKAVTKSVNQYMVGSASWNSYQSVISPMPFWATARLETRSASFVFDMLTPILLGFLIVLAYIAVRRTYLHFYPPPIQVLHSRGTARSGNEDALRELERRLTLFELATGAELNNRFGFLAEYDNALFIKSVKFASADGIYSNGFIIVNGKFLLQSKDYWALVLMKVMRLRYRNIFAYELEGTTVKQTARLVYPQTITWTDLDVREMMTNPSDQYAAAPLESNMFDWHFTLRGPRDTEFEGGVYHGRILLPADYPFKPPNIMLLTPNGRFEVRKKICLSISAYHPEEWQPAWGVRLILEALISFMPTKGEGAIGALDFSPEERRRLAKQSVHFSCDTCGRVVDLLPELQADADAAGAEKKPSKYAAQIAQLHMHSLEPAAASAEPGEVSGDSADATTLDEPASPTASEPDNAGSTAANAQNAAAAAAADAQAVRAEPDAGAARPPAVETGAAAAAAAETPATTREPSSVDTFLHYLTVAVLVALFALVYKKLLKMQGVLHSPVARQGSAPMSQLRALGAAEPSATPVKSAKPRSSRISRGDVVRFAHRLAVFAAALFYAVSCFRAIPDTVHLLRGNGNEQLLFAPEDSAVMRAFVGTTTLRASPLVVAALNGSTQPVSGTLYLDAGGASFSLCRGGDLPPDIQLLYENSHLRTLYSTLASSLSYNITMLAAAETELVAPVVDCSISQIADGVATFIRPFYLVRKVREPDDVYMIPVRMSTMEYLLPDQAEGGPAGVATIAFINDLRVTAVEHYTVVSIGFPFGKLDFRATDFDGLTREGAWSLLTIPRDPARELSKRTLVAARAGCYVKTESEQSNVNHFIWVLDPLSAMKTLVQMQFTSIAVLQDSWAWVHLVELWLGLDVLVSLAILLLVSVHNLRGGVLWLGDAFVAVSSTQFLRGAAVALSLYVDKFWSLTEFATYDAGALTGLQTLSIYESITHADLLSLYLCFAGLLGVLLRARVDPLAAVCCFELGYGLRRDVLAWFPELTAAASNFARTVYAPSTRAAAEEQRNLTPMRFRSTVETTASGEAILAALVAIPLSFVLVVLFVAASKLYFYSRRDKLLAVRATASASAAPASDNEAALLAHKRQFTRFEVATGTQLEKRVGLLSHGAPSVCVGGAKFASLDGVYSNGFVVANGKFLVQARDLVWIALMKLSGSRFANVYVYELQGDAVQQKARLVYPETLAWRDIVLINLTILS
ncbi:hypothetical protein PybrP1_005053, partial [[Pythium] brassicae (nom. inval.)]